MHTGLGTQLTLFNTVAKTDVVVYLGTYKDTELTSKAFNMLLKTRRSSLNYVFPKAPPEAWSGDELSYEVYVKDFSRTVAPSSTAKKRGPVSEA